VPSPIPGSIATHTAAADLNDISGWEDIARSQIGLSEVNLGNDASLRTLIYVYRDCSRPTLYYAHIDTLAKESDGAMRTLLEGGQYVGPY